MCVCFLVTITVCWSGVLGF